MASMFELTLGNWAPVMRLLSEEVSEWFMFICADAQEVCRACGLAPLAADAVFNPRRGGDLLRGVHGGRDHLQDIGGAGADAEGAADAGVVDLDRVRSQGGGLLLDAAPERGGGGPEHDAKAQRRGAGHGGLRRGRLGTSAGGRLEAMCAHLTRASRRGCWEGEGLRNPDAAQQRGCGDKRGGELMGPHRNILGGVSRSSS